jgi:hypothetical protein
VNALIDLTYIRRYHLNYQHHSNRTKRNPMDTHLLVGVAVMLGLIGIAASRELLRILRPQPQLVPIKVSRPVRSDRSDIR